MPPVSPRRVRIAAVLAAVVALVACRRVRNETPSWTPIGPASAIVTTLAVDPLHAGVVYAGTRASGLLRREPTAHAWDPVSVAAAASTDVRAIVFDTRNPDVAYLGTGRGRVFATSDGGVTWTDTHLVGTSAHTPILALAIDPADSARVLVGLGGGGIVERTAAGSARIGGALETVDVTALVFDPTRPSTVWAATAGKGVARTTDAGRTWAPVSDGLAVSAITALALDPRGPAMLYAATSGGGVYAMPIDETHWRPAAGGLTTSVVWSLVVDPVHPGTIVAGASAGGVFISRDRGAHWTPGAHGIGSTVWALAIDTAGTVYAGTSGDGVYTAPAL